MACDFLMKEIREDRDRLETENERLREALTDLLRISTWDGEFTTREEYEPVAERALALLRTSNQPNSAD